MVKKKSKKITKPRSRGGTHPRIRDSFEGGDRSARNSQAANRVWVSLSKTINIGNYESVRAEVGRGRQVDNNTSHDEVYEVLKEEVLTDLADLVETVESVLKP